MSSISNLLKTRLEQIKSRNGGVSSLRHVTLTSARQASGDSFATGPLEYNMDLPMDSYILPRESYMKVRLQFSLGNDTVIADAKSALAMNVGANLFQSMEWQIGGRTVSHVGNGQPQIAALKTRQSKSKAWLDGIGWAGPRMQSLQSDRNTDAKLAIYDEVLFVPCLGIFDQAILPPGQHKLILTPYTQAQIERYAVEIQRTQVMAAGLTAADFKISIISCQFVVAVGQADRWGDGLVVLDMNEIAMQSNTYGTSTGLVQNSYQVPPTTRALTLAWQPLTVSSTNTASISKFTDPVQELNVALRPEQRLTSRQIVFGNQQYPPISDITSKTLGGYDYMRGVYLESQLATGQFHGAGGGETYTDFLERGLYIHVPTPRDASDKSTHVEVHTQLSDVSIQVSQLLFAHYTHVAQILYKGGRVVDVSSTQM